MNIQVQFSGLLIVSLIMIFFFGNKKIGLYTESIFARVLIGSFVCLVLDITSVIFIVNESPATEIICKAYLVSLLWMGFGGFDYIMTDLLSEKRYYAAIHIFISIAIVESLIIVIADIDWVHEGRVVYSFGPATNLTYYFTFLLIFMTMIILVIKRKTLNKRRRLAMTLWLTLWIVSALAQYIFNEFLLVGFAIALGMLTIFFMLENPESQQDRRFGCFNSHALLLYLSQVYERGEKCHVIDLNFGKADNDADIMYDGVIEDIVRYFDALDDTKVFKCVENEIIVFTPQDKMIADFRVGFNEAVNRMMQNVDRADSDKRIPITVIDFDDCSRVKTKDDMFGLLSQVRERNGEKAGLNFVSVTDEDVQHFYRYVEVVAEIKNALAEDRVEVFYQPIYSVNKGHFTCCEALARIRKSDGSMLSPGEFIPIAEDTGLISELGERVFAKVCEFLSKNRSVYSELDYVEVNLSVVQFEKRDLAGRYISIMEGYGVAASKINFEITETASIQAKQNLLENMERFLDYGVIFSLDDFGKGQSNLMYVVEMPVSLVKLDMDMTKAYFVEPKARHVVAATVRMAHGLGLEVVAEGVEDREEYDEIKRADIDYVQGYYFSRPLPADEFLELIRK